MEIQSDDEEDFSVYYRENADILKLIDDLQERDSPLGFKKGESHAVIPELRDMPLPREDGYIDTFEEAQNAKHRPFSKGYLSDQVKRLRLLEQNSDFRWAQYMAGAMGREVHEVYREDDLQRVLLERERTREIMKADIKRTILPLKEKQDQLLLLQAERKRLLSDYDQLDLTVINDIGSKSDALVTGNNDLMGYIKVAKIHNFFKNVTEKKFQSDRLNKDEKKAITDYLQSHIYKDSKDDVDPVELENMKSVFSSNTDEILTLAKEVVMLNEHVFDATSKEGIVYIVKHEKTVVFKELSPSIVTTDLQWHTTNLELQGFSGTNIGEEFWISLIGHEISYLPYISEIYPNDVIEMMIMKGANEYANHWESPSNYPESMLQYITYNMFDDVGGHHLFQDQPQSIKNCLLTVFFSIPSYFPVDENESILMRNKFAFILRAHFLWKYFHESSGLVLAYHYKLAKNDSKLRDTVRFYNFFLEILERYDTSLLALYNDSIIPEMREMRGVNQLPLFDLSKVSVASDILIEGRSTSLRNQQIFDFINDPDFRSYFIKGRSFFVTTSEENIPLTKKEYTSIPNKQEFLQFHWLFITANQYLQKYKLYLADKLIETEKTIIHTKELMAKIASERNPMNGSSDFSGRPPYSQSREFVTKAINSGLISLKPEITHFMAIAHTKIQLYCPGLEGLPLEEFQADHANNCGLENDFAAYVAALIAKNGNIYQRSYKSKHHERAILTNDTETMHALKYYRFSTKRWSTSYTTWRESVPLTVAREERRMVQAKRRLIL